VIATTGGSHEKAAPVATAHHPPPPVTSPATAPASGWSIAAEPCAGGVVVALNVPDGDGERSSCERPRRDITVHRRYARSLRATFVYGVTTGRVQKVEVRAAPKPTTVDTTQTAGSDLRVYVARIDGRRRAKSVVAISNGRPVESTNEPERTATATPQKHAPASPANAKPRGVALPGGSGWQIQAEKCGKWTFVYTPFTTGRPPSGSQCARRTKIGAISAYTRYVPGADLTVVAGFAAGGNYVRVEFAGGKIVSAHPKAPATSAGYFPKHYELYVVTIKGRHKLRGMTTWFHQVQSGCVGRCVKSPFREPEPEPGPGPPPATP
jgi:hypothetical protein